MAHLTPDQLLDVAEGTRALDEFPHVRACAACDRQLQALVAAISAAAAVEVPEPSPLFWDHLSARIGERLASERAKVRWWGWWMPAHSWQLVAGATFVLAVALAVAIGFRQDPPPDATVPVALSAVEPGVADEAFQAFDDDPALTLISELTADMDWESASEAGLVPPPGAVDRAVFALTVDERRELQRILQEGLAGPGA